MDMPPVARMSLSNRGMTALFPAYPMPNLSQRLRRSLDGFGCLAALTLRHIGTQDREVQRFGWDGWRESSRCELLAACTAQRLPRRPLMAYQGSRRILRS